MEHKNSDTGKTTELSGRKRKKLYIKLRAQMEFYFSDSNLAKDKFLYNLIQHDKDGYVDLEVFKSFNKIKALSDDINLLAASLSKSNILELNESNSRVRRKTPIQISKDFDACTLYVEGLSLYADLKWIRDVFDHFGTVEYINIPRFNISQKIKGFAFIEFSNPESVKNACQFYKNSSDVNNGSCLKENKVKEVDDDDDALSSKEMETSSKSIPKDKLEDEFQDRLADSKTNSDEFKSKKKRKLDGDDNECETSSKKKKVVEETVTSVPKDDEKYEHKSDQKINTDNPDDLGSNDEEQSSKSKKKRNHSKKNRNRHERPSLRVMSKYEWKTYRNKYLDLQRTTMSYLKKQILLECQEIREQEDNVKVEPALKKELKFQPGVIVKIKLPKAIENATEIKEQIKSCAIVAYIDAPMGSEEVFIRCHSMEDASSIIEDKKLHNLGDVELLSGLGEEKYWEKIQRDRENKLNTPVVRKRRGRDKLISKAAKLVEQRNKHIYFDE